MVYHHPQALAPSDDQLLADVCNDPTKGTAEQTEQFHPHCGNLLFKDKQRRQGAEREEAEAGAEAAAGPTRRVTRLSLGSDRDMTLSGGLPHPRSPIKAS